MKFLVGDYFKVTTGNKHAGVITGVRAQSKVGEEVRRAYYVVWAHHPDKKACLYAVDIVDQIWEPATKEYFDSRPMEYAKPPEKKPTVISVPVGFVIDEEVMNKSVYKRAGETMTITFKADGCDHDMKPYMGFRESYEFCTKCDHKKDIPK